MPDEQSVASRGALIIPVKPFAKAKERLSHALSRDERIALAQRTARGVIEVATSLPQFTRVEVVCDDEATAQWARDVGVAAMTCPLPGLNAAVSHAYAIMRATHDWVAICHADIADPRGLAGVSRPDPHTLTIVPDRHGLGTNVLALNASDDFIFHYGPTSFADHCAEALRRGLSVLRLDDPGLALDLDTPDDIALLAHHPKHD